MKLTRTIIIDGKSREEYEQITAHIDELQNNFPGWSIQKDPLLHKVTATKTDEVESL